MKKRYVFYKTKLFQLQNIKFIFHKQDTDDKPIRFFESIQMI